MRALISTYDKRGLSQLARWLAGEGIEILATGGTAAALSAEGIPVQDTQDLTGFGPLLSGRVKTLHPAIFAGILADGTDAHARELAEGGIAPIDLVVSNLYPFRSHWLAHDDPDALVEQVDVGGVSLMRAAAKNFARVVILSDPSQYADAMARGIAGWDRDYRRELAAYAFRLVAAYDADIAQAFTEWAGPRWPERLTITGDRASDLRYGENPHQAAAVYRLPGAPSWADHPPLQGKALSYNNWADADAAWRLAWDLPGPGAVGLKHQTPCGVALAAPAEAAYRAVQAADPVSIFGGIVAFNQPLDAAGARALVDGGFLEVVIAPEVTPEARAVLAAKKNLRVLVAGAPPASDERQLRSVAGALLVQDGDRREVPPSAWRRVAGPERAVSGDALLAWVVAQHAKSNAVVLVRDGATVGIGQGQTNRVDAVRHAIARAGDRARGAVLGSDAFFFPDTVEALGEAGVAMAISPGGSVQDQAVVEAAKSRGITLYFTGERHFRH